MTATPDQPAASEPPSPRTDRGPWIWIGAGAAVAIIAIALGVAFALGGEHRRPDVDFPQDTPERVVESAYELLSIGRADQLPRLIHAESPEMRGVLNRLGDLLGSLQQLAAAIQENYPDEVADIRDNVQREGANISLGFGPGGEGPPAESVSRILADPFGWLERNRERVTVMQIADDSAAVMVDGKPAFGLGLSMIKRDEQWYIALPLNLPMVRRYLPQSHDEWAIVASILDVFRNVVVELRDEIDSGQYRDLESVSQRAGEKVAAPAVMCFMAYNRAIEARDAETD